MRCAAIGQVVAVDRRHDDVLEPHLRGGLGEAQRLERVDRLRLRRADVAVAAGPGAALAEDLEITRSSLQRALASIEREARRLDTEPPLP